MSTKENQIYKNIIDQIKSIYKSNYGDDNTEIIERIFNDVIDLFNGKREGFQGCDAKYHDFSHTLQTIPPFIEIIDGWNKSEKTPKITKDFFDMGIIGVLMHDTGYMKTINDIEGTGAKYTFTHIQRSADFAGHYLKQMGFENHKILSIQNAIKCTGVKVNLNDIQFNSEEERVLGYALGSADFLGQMSADNYLKKLPILYKEYEEAYRHEGIERLHEINAIIFESAEHLIRNTPNFFENVVMVRFKSMGSVYTYLTYHFNSPKIPYLAAIEENLKKIRLGLMN